MYGLAEKVSIADQVHFQAYEFGKGITAPRFRLLQCYNCNSEFVNVVRDHGTHRDYVCNGCFQGFAVETFIPVGREDPRLAA